MLAHNSGASLAFDQFKVNNGLSYADICDLFNCTMAEARARSNSILQKLRHKDMDDIGRQFFEKEKSKIVEENQQLKIKLSEIHRLSSPDSTIKGVPRTVQEIDNVCRGTLDHGRS